MFPAGGAAGAAASDRGTSLLGQEPPQNVFQHPGDVALVGVVRKAAAKRNRANRENRPARRRLEIQMSARIKASGRSPVTVVAWVSNSSGTTT